LRLGGRERAQDDRAAGGLATGTISGRMMGVTTKLAPASMLARHIPAW